MVNAYIKKKGSQINNLTLQLKELEKEQTKPKGDRSEVILEEKLIKQNRKL